ncbi:MAG: hypothetical protein AAF962_03325 [Actinomycetota bacterium]
MSDDDSTSGEVDLGSGTDDLDLETHRGDLGADEAELGFGGHDADNGNLHLSVPEVALAQTLGAANAGGSPKARRQAKIVAWVLILTFVLPIVLGLLVSALGWI